MRFEVDPELRLFAESVRTALGGWEGPLEPALGTWWDERDDALGARLRAAGWDELWEAPELLGAAVAGAVELGRAVAPLCILDESTLGAPLSVAGRTRHASGAGTVAVALPGGGLELAALTGGNPEPTLDGTGTLRRAETAPGAQMADADDRWRAWATTTLGYLAGVADAALEAAVAHALAREQFGAPLARLPAVQARLADAALLRDGLELSAWGAADPAGPFPADALAWAGGACRAVTAEAVQAHGAIGFALESGVHRWFRRAKTVQVWVDALLEVRGAAATPPRR